MTPEQLAASNAHANALARERRKRDPTKRRAIEARYRQRKKLRSFPGVVVDFSDW
jgi:hypothetical protein